MPSSFTKRSRASCGHGSEIGEASFASHAIVSLSMEAFSSAAATAKRNTERGSSLASGLMRTYFWL